MIYSRDVEGIKKRKNKYFYRWWYGISPGFYHRLKMDAWTQWIIDVIIGAFRNGDIVIFEIRWTVIKMFMLFCYWSGNLQFHGNVTYVDDDLVRIKREYDGSSFISLW